MTTPSSPVPVIETRGLSRVLPGAVPVTLVRDVSLSFMAGEFAAVTGPSGSGKSSLMYLLGLLDGPTAGTVRLKGRDTTGLADDALADLRLGSLGFVFQFHFLLPEFTALGNVMMPMRRLGGKSDAEIAERAHALLDGFGLGAMAGKRPDQLSGGERQRVAIARALANDLDLILADEPTGNLDSKNGEAVFEIFTRLVREQGRTVIVVTHDMNLSARTGRRVHLVDGRVAADERA